jgi:hypothetical protein
MHALRRSKLRHLLEVEFKGDRGVFLKKSGLTKGRLSQLLDPKEPFGDVAARNLAERLELPPGYFDQMDAQTLKWAVAFDSLPQPIKDKWAELVRMMGGATTPPE